MRRLLKFAGLVLAVLVAAVAGCVAYGSRDLPRVDDADLFVPRTAVHPEMNVRTHLDRLTPRIGWSAEIDQEVRDLARSEHLDRARAVALVARDLRVLEALEPALAAPEFQIPARQEENPPGGETPVEFQYHRLAWGLALRSRLAAEEGHVERAVRDAFLILDFGNRLEGAMGAPLLSVMTAKALKKIGLDALDHLSATSELDREMAREIAERLGDYRGDADAYARMWAVEYQWIKARSIGLLKEPLDGDPASDIPWWLPKHYVFHPKRSLERLGDRYRAYQRGANSCAPIEKSLGWNARDPFDKLRVVLSPNSVGELLLVIGTPNFDRFNLKRCLLDVEVEATKVRLALRAYRNERGELPPQLTALVPRYLSEIPRDSFDGQRLRYDAAEALVWSVGADFQDHHGARREGEDPLLEPAFPI